MKDVTVSWRKPPGKLAPVSHPLQARLVLLAAATALAVSMIFAVIVAEHRDGPTRAATPGAAAGDTRGVDALGAPPVTQLQTVRLARQPLAR